MTGIIAALPREVAKLTRGIKPETKLVERGIFAFRRASTVVVCAGMGSQRAVLAVRAALDCGVDELLVSAGLAGSCDPSIRVGTIVEASQIIDVRSGERFAGSEDSRAVLVTSPSIANVAEKLRLHQSYGASIVDMEAATVARLAHSNGLKFRAIKAVSDGYDFELEGLARFATPSGQFRTGAFALYTALHPQNWSSAMQLGKGSKQALNALTEALEKL
jgi:adenosylhomocysteine nucleosidase